MSSEIKVTNYKAKDGTAGLVITDSSGDVKSTAKFGVRKTAVASLDVKSNADNANDSGISIEANSNTNRLFQLGEATGQTALQQMYSGNTETIRLHANSTSFINGKFVIGGTTQPIDTGTVFSVESSGINTHLYRKVTTNSDEIISMYSNYGITENLVFRVLTGGTSYNDTGVFTVFPSDERLKKEIKETSPKLDKLLKLPIKSYYTTKDPNFKKMGVTAQDLEKVMPSLVDFVNVDETTPMVQKDDNGKLLLNDEGKPYVLDKNGDKLSKIKYTKDSLLLFCAIKAIQELSAKVTALENA